jgi:hypothetical protein
MYARAGYARAGYARAGYARAYAEPIRIRTVQMILERNNVATILFCLHKLGVPSGYASSHFAHASSHFAHASSH